MVFSKHVSTSEKNGIPFYGITYCIAVFKDSVPYIQNSLYMLISNEICIFHHEHMILSVFMTLKGIDKILLNSFLLACSYIPD